MYQSRYVTGVAALAGGVALLPGAGRDEDGMLRMSILEHLDELRTRLFYAIAGVIVAFVLSMGFSARLWAFVCQPAAEALKALGYKPYLVQIGTVDAMNIIYFKLPAICALFLGSPWIVYQVWAFIAPGLYQRERRWAAPFLVGCGSLFLAGGVFAYFVVFRYGLTFLLGIAGGNFVEPAVSMVDYFDTFVNVTVGVGLVFELPVVILLLTLLRIADPGFLLRHSRYAILGIFLLASFVTPTPDVVNLMLFAVPMCLLFYVGVLAAYLLVLQREGRRFPWRKFLISSGAVLILAGGGLYVAIAHFGVAVLPHWPFLMRSVPR